MSRRVVAFGAWDEGEGYPRATSLLAGLRAAGYEVIECRVELPFKGVSKRKLIRQPWRWPGYAMKSWRVRGAACRRLRQAVREHQPDAVLVPYPGQLTVRWARSVFRGPLLLDLFLSAYDTAVSDRGWFTPGSLPARALAWLDRRACRAASRILVDTPQNAQRFAQRFGLPRDRFVCVPVSNPNAPVKPKDYRGPVPGERLQVLFFGTGVPLHGLSTLLEAIERCPGVRLTLVGGSTEDRSKAAALGAKQVQLQAPFLPMDELVECIHRSHVVAGVFGTSEKADSVVPLKVMTALSHGWPVLTGDTAAVRELMQPERDCLVVPCGDAAALAAALQELRDAPYQLSDVAAAGLQTYRSTFSIEALAERLREVCEEQQVAVPAAASPAHAS